MASVDCEYTMIGPDFDTKGEYMFNLEGRFNSLHLGVFCNSVMTFQLPEIIKNHFFKIFYRL